jgi:hypothetical protein
MASAQTPAAPPLNAAAQLAASIPSAPPISILILAFDELGVPVPLQALPPAPVTIDDIPDPAPPAIVPAVPAPQLAPMQWNGPDVRWQASAQRKKKENDFTLAPEPGGLIPLPVKPVTPRAAPPTPSAPLVAAEAAAPPGRAQTAAVSLRRALVARGFREVMTAAPDSSSVVRALSERRLTPRVMRELQSALQILSAGAPIPTRRRAPCALHRASVRRSVIAPLSCFTSRHQSRAKRILKAPDGIWCWPTARANRANRSSSSNAAPMNPRFWKAALSPPPPRWNVRCAVGRRLLPPIKRRLRKRI